MSPTSHPSDWRSWWTCFPESRERSRVARIPELQNGGTRLAEVPDQERHDRRQRRANDDEVTDESPSSHIDSPFSSICNLHFAICILQCLLLSGCVGYQVGTGSLYAPDVATVYVPMIESDSYRRDLGERLTEAVVKEIELKTPYKVVSTPDADSMLSARLLTDTRQNAGQERVRRLRASRKPRFGPR